MSKKKKGPKKGSDNEEEDPKHPNRDPRRQRKTRESRGVENSERAKQRREEKEQRAQREEREQERRAPDIEPVVEPGMSFRLRFLNPFLKGKIRLNPRSIWLTRQIRTLEINPSRGSGCHRRVKVALMLIADVKRRERRARVVLMMILNKKLRAHRGRMANLVKRRARAALMTIKVMIR
jgi:hypothetical protein